MKYPLGTLSHRLYPRMLLIYLIPLLALTSCESSRPHTDLPTIRELSITMPDGINLAADLYIPHDFDSTSPYPIILEYLPYRKDEHRKSRYGVFNYFVQQGYLVARVDIRGTGRSEGTIIPYEYSEQELDDGEAVIDYLSKQDYSNGNVAMFGISWGGFNGLQLAMRKPAALKTIVSLMSTDDLYQDDVHFMDGILHVDAYEIGRDLDNAFPAAPDFTLDSAYFRDRFFSEPWLLKYKQQQRDGAFWNRASLNSHYEGFDTPTFLIAGLYDGYRDLVERFFEQTEGPKRAIIGPWNHTWPHHNAYPPSVEWRKEVVDWLDQWMLDEVPRRQAPYPELIYYQRDYHDPTISSGQLPGVWKVVDKWSELERAQEQRFLISEGKTLNTQATSTMVMDTVNSRPSDGVEGGGPVMWWGDWAPDQAPFDAPSLVYDLPIESELSIMGYPKIQLCVQSPVEHTNWFVRLNDVAPDGQVTQVTGAGFNSTHRQSSTSPTPSPVGATYCMDIELHWTTWTFRPGHQLRISISNAQWPMFWPTPERSINLVQNGGDQGSYITLPLSPNNAQTGYDWAAIQPDPKLPDYESLTTGTTSGFAEVNRVAYDTATQTRRVIAINEWDEAYPWGTYENYESIVHSCSDLDPANTSVIADYQLGIQLPNRKIKIETNLDFSSDQDSFYYFYQRKILENDQVLRTANWKKHFARDFQ